MEILFEGYLENPCIEPPFLLDQSMQQTLLYHVTMTRSFVPGGPMRMEVRNTVLN